MNYKNLVDPELRPIAQSIPYNRAVIACANFFLPIALRLTPVPKGLRRRVITVNGHKGFAFRAELFEPSDAEGRLPALIDLHGGAFSYKASPYHKRLACLYAAGARCRVFFPDYHLTPKYPYPAAYDDAAALFRHMTEHAEAFGVDPERICVAGDSAGGALAALICSRYASEGLERPRAQMLIYPLTDVTMQTDSMKKFPDTPLWNARNNRRMWAFYCGHLSGDAARAASPMHSALPAKLPDTYIETAEYDCLRDEGVLYGERLRKAGANVEINETRGTFHGYDSALTAGVAKRNIEKRIAFLKKALRGGSAV